MSDTQNSSERDQKRRSVLESLQIQPAVSGRLVAGLTETDRVLVASFNNPSVGERFRRELSDLGITSWRKADGIKTAIEVAYRDRLVAFERCAEFRHREPDEVPVTLRRPHDFAIFGGIIGAIVGIASLPFEFPLRIFIWLGFILNGAFLGYVLDPVRRRRQRGVSGQFSVVDLLLLTTAVAVLFASMKYLLEISATLTK